MQLTGLHHLTAITADAAANHAFYTRVLGMRLVKKTVNQDDTSAYHLFYADGEANPGTDLTFFEFPVPPETRGTHSIARTGLRVTGGAALAFWADRLRVAGVTTRAIVERDGRLTLDFEDPEGQRLSLVDDGGTGPGVVWDASPIEAAFQIRGLGPITLSVPDIAATERVLTDVMAMTPLRDFTHGRTVRVFGMADVGPAAELHVAIEPDLPPSRQGAGGVHHVAFRIPDADYEDWADRVKSLRMPSSGPVDRFWFRSLYFREPNGILFEIATDGPGFAVDEPIEKLGQALVLPPFLEGKRAAIEAKLRPI